MKFKVNCLHISDRESKKKDDMEDNKAVGLRSENISKL